LPDFLAAKLPDLLESIEDAVATALSVKSLEAAADALRGFDVSLPGALRWLHRRVRAVRAAVDAVSRLVLERPSARAGWASSLAVAAVTEQPAGATGLPTFIPSGPPTRHGA
jgi:hypothetical protein